MLSNDNRRNIAVQAEQHRNVCFAMFDPLTALLNSLESGRYNDPQ
jgi:hypothetical protein